MWGSGVSCDADAARDNVRMLRGRALTVRVVSQGSHLSQGNSVGVFHTQRVPGFAWSRAGERSAVEGGWEAPSSTKGVSQLNRVGSKPFAFCL